MRAAVATAAVHCVMCVHLNLLEAFDFPAKQELV